MAFGPDVAAVTFDYSLDGRESNSETLEFRGRVEPLKGCEQAVRAGHVKTCAVIANEESAVTVGAKQANFDPRVGLVATEFPGIAEKVLQNQAQQPRVPMSYQVRLNNT